MRALVLALCVLTLAVAGLEAKPAIVNPECPAENCVCNKNDGSCLCTPESSCNVPVPAPEEPDTISACSGGACSIVAGNSSAKSYAVQRSGPLGRVFGLFRGLFARFRSRCR